MPRGNQMRSEDLLEKTMILADAKAGKTDWALRALEGGFNVLMLDGDVGAQTIADVARDMPQAMSRLFYMNVGDQIVNGDYETRMIEFVGNFFAATRFIWNDSQQREFNRAKDVVDGVVADEIWEFRPSQLNHNWVLILDSWTTLSYSGMVAKAKDLGVAIEDVEKVNREIYAGVGNRLTNIAIVLQKIKCHVIVTGHPAEYQKQRRAVGTTQRNASEADMVLEWSRMIPKSSSNPHGLTLPKYFSDVGWIDIDRVGKRLLDFTVTDKRVSGGHLTGKGDPRGEYSFVNLLKRIGAALPATAPETAPALTIHEPGTYSPAATNAKPLGIGKPQASSNQQPAAPLAVAAPKGLMALKLASTKGPTDTPTT